MKLPSKIAAGSAVAALVLGLASPALATNLGSHDGVKTAGCAVTWNGKTVMNTQLKNDDPEYPGLMTGLDGKPIPAFENGGYIDLVSPLVNHEPGMLEITHFYGGAGTMKDGDDFAGPDYDIHWRTILSSDHTIKDATYTLTVPSDMDVSNWQMEMWSDAMAAKVAAWGGHPVGSTASADDPYTQYSWKGNVESQKPTQSGNTFTFKLGDLPAGTGLVLDLKGKVKEGTKLNQNYVASSQLTGAYEIGVEDCTAPVPTTGNPSPSQSGEPTPTESGNPTPTESGTATPSATGTPTSTPSASTTSAPAPGTDRPSSDNPRPGDNGDDGDDDNGGKLPRTGSDAVAPLLAAGGALLLVGAAVLLFVRRRRS